MSITVSAPLPRWVPVECEWPEEKPDSEPTPLPDAGNWSVVVEDVSSSPLSARSLSARSLSSRSRSFLARSSFSFNWKYYVCYFDSFQRECVSLPFVCEWRKYRKIPRVAQTENDLSKHNLVFWFMVKILVRIFFINPWEFLSDRHSRVKFNWLLPSILSLFSIFFLL